MLEHGGPDLGAPVTWDFSTNANPMGPLAGAMQALALADRRTYPEPSYLALRRACAQAGLGPVARLLPTAGNAEAIRRLTLAARLAGLRHVWVPGPGYGEYAAAARALGLTVRAYGSVPELVTQLSRARQAALVWVCEPCNPTGDDVSAATWAELAAVLSARAKTAQHQLAIDRAYAPMRLDGQDPVPAALAEAAWQLWSPNKALGCTGVRAGLMVAPARPRRAWPDVGELAPSWVLGSEGVALLQAWVTPAVQATLKVQREVWQGWLRAQQSLLRVQGWTVRESVVPFFLAQPPVGTHLPTLLQALRGHGIKLRDATSLGLPGWCRLRVMPPEAQQALAQALVQATPSTATDPVAPAAAADAANDSSGPRPAAA